MAITSLGNVSIKPKGEWSSNTSYLKNDIVSYQGSTYLAKSAPPAGTLPTNTTYWMLCAAKGTPGDAVPITEWSSSTAYSVGDKVAHEGSSYYCIQAHTNQEPPNATYWMVIGAKGEPGDVSTAQMNQAIEDALGPVASQLADIAEHTDNAALWRTATGNPATIYPVPKSRLYPRIELVATQEGEGDPSLENVRSIVASMQIGNVLRVTVGDGADENHTYDLLTADRDFYGLPGAPVVVDAEAGTVTVRDARVVLTGAETVELRDPLTNTVRCLITGVLISAPAPIASGSDTGMCTHAKYLASAATDEVLAYASGVNVSVRLPKIIATSAGAVKAFLAAQYAAGTPVTVQYQLATPITIPVAPPVITALERLSRTAARQNVVVATANDGAVSKLDVTYQKSPTRESDAIATDVNRTATVVVVAADSLDTYGYDFKCTGENDEETIAAAIAALPTSGGKVVLREGHYSKGNAQPIALPSNVEIEILAGATFALASGINSDACFFSNADKVNGNTNIRIHGAGKFDCNFRNQTDGTYQYLADFDKVANGLIDVYITNFTMLEAKLKRSRVDLINRKFMQPEVLLAECESISEFVYTSGTVVTNTGGGVFGGNCIKMTPTSTTPAVVGKALPDSDLEDEEYLAYEAEVYIKADDPSKIKELTIGAGPGSSADELAVVIDSTTQVTKLFEAGKWHRIRVPMNRYIVSGVPQFRVIVRGNETTDVYLGRIRLLPAPLRPALTWIWDDATGGTSEHKALPGIEILAKYGHSGAIAQMGSAYVGGTQYMTLDELDHVCFELGWDICVHSYTHLEDDVPLNDAISLLVANKTFIEQRGWKGSNYLVFAGHDTRGEITSEVNKVFNDYRNPLQYPPIARQGRISVAQQIVTLSEALPRIKQSLRRHLWLSHYSHGVGGTQVSASELELWAQFFYDWGLISKPPSEIISGYNPRYNMLTT